MVLNADRVAIVMLTPSVTVVKSTWDLWNRLLSLAKTGRISASR